MLLRQAYYCYFGLAYLFHTVGRVIDYMYNIVLQTRSKDPVGDSSTALTNGRAWDFSPLKLKELKGSIATQLQKQETHRQWYTSTKVQVIEPQYSDTACDNSQSIFPSTPHLKEVFDFIEANYHKSITLHDVSQAVGYSRAYLTNLVANQTGQTVNRWIVQRRMAQARFLLRNTNQSVEQIAALVGYQTLCNFFRQFRQVHGKTPQAWRKENQ